MKNLAENKISVVIPVYYNAQSLPILFKELTEVEIEFNKQQVELELIFVDDGSGDDSYKELLSIKSTRPETKIIKLTRNFGAVSSSKCGLNFVTGNCFTIMAADLQDPPSLLFSMYEQWVLGSKFTICVRESRLDPPISKIFSQFFYWLLRLFVMKDFPKEGYNIALMDSTILPFITNSSKNLYTPLLVFWLGFKPTYIKYDRKKRIHGKSRWSTKKKIKAFLDVFLGFSVSPLRVMSGIGICVAVSSFIYGGSSYQCTAWQHCLAWICRNYFPNILFAGLDHSNAWDNWGIFMENI